MSQASEKSLYTPTNKGIGPTAAVQLPDGEWSSKLGLYEDISHRTPESLDPDFYGEVHCFMRRPL